MTIQSGRLVALATALLLSMLAQAHPQQQGPGADTCPMTGANMGSMMGGPMMMGGSMMGGSMMGGPVMIGSMVGQPDMLSGHMRMLGRMLGVADLSAEQRKALTTRHRELHRELWRLEGKEMDARFALQDVLDQDSPDPKAVGSALQGVFDVRRQMAEAVVAASNDGRKVLTKAQLESLNRPGPMGMGAMGMHGERRMMQQ